MNAQALTAPGELGEAASEAIGDLLTRATGGEAISAYAEGVSPLPWSVIAEGGWDFIGVEDDETVPLRDLAAVAKTWGSACLQLPLIQSLIIKRHAIEAQEHDGPLTMSLALGRDAAQSIVPFGQIDEVRVVRSLGNGEALTLEAPTNIPSDFDILLCATESAWTTEVTAVVAQELAVLLAAEAVGAAERLLNEALEYVRERQQFGKPIGSFQAVKHRLASALIDLEMADTAVIWGSIYPEKRALQAAEFSLSRALRVAEAVLQAEGGMGFTWEMGVHFPMRRIITSRDIVTALAQQHA